MRFSLKGPDGAFVDEPDIEAELERFREVFLAVDGNLGRLMIRAAGGQCAVIEDELDYLVPELCFRSLTTLAHGQPVNIRLSAYSDVVTISPSGSDMHISGRHIADLTCSAEQLLRAMSDCGDRFLSCYQGLRGGLKDFDWRIRDIQAARQAAQAGAEPASRRG